MNKQLQSQREHALEVLLCPRVLESMTSDSGTSVFVMQTPYKEVVDEDVGYWFQIRSKSVRVVDLHSPFLRYRSPCCSCTGSVEGRYEPYARRRCGDANLLRWCIARWPGSQRLCSPRR